MHRDALDRVAGERAAIARGKQRTSGLVAGFAQPGAEHRDGLLGQRHDALLSALPTVRTCAPVPSCASARVRPSSSEIRSPVCTAVSNSAWSRRPAQGLTKQLGGRIVVSDVTFPCDPGTVTGVLGPNGAGTIVPESVSSSARVPCAWMLPPPMIIIRSATASTSTSSTSRPTDWIRRHALDARLLRGFADCGGRVLLSSHLLVELDNALRRAGLAVHPADGDRRVVGAEPEIVARAAMADGVVLRRLAPAEGLERLFFELTAGAADSPPQTADTHLELAGARIEAQDLDDACLSIQHQPERLLHLHGARVLLLQTGNAAGKAKAQV